MTERVDRSKVYQDGRLAFLATVDPDPRKRDPSRSRNPFPAPETVRVGGLVFTAGDLFGQREIWQRGFDDAKRAHREKRKAG